MQKLLVLPAALFFLVRVATAKELLTNAALFIDPPQWLTEYKVNEVVNRVEQKLEWSTHRVKVYWYADQASLVAAFGRPAPTIMAFTRRTDDSIHIGPKVTSLNFALYFGHELSHVIMFQKYKGVIPGWLEEGLANQTAGNIKVDYKWLAAQPRQNVTQMTHPFDARSIDEVNFKYMASLAAILMLEKKCPSLRELINLGLKKNIETFIPTYCGIKDMNTEFWAWVDGKAKG